jgi:hypothetical protein
MAISGAYAIRNPARFRRTVRSRSSEKKSGVRPPTCCTARVFNRALCPMNGIQPNRAAGARNA